MTTEKKEELFERRLAKLEEAEAVRQRGQVEQTDWDWIKGVMTVTIMVAVVGALIWEQVSFIYKQ